MDIKLPDGTVVQNVPDGTSQKDLLDRLAQSGYDVAPIQRQMMIPIGKAGLGQAAKEAAKEQSIVGQIGAGIGTAPLLAKQGLAGLVGMSNPEDIAATKAVAGATPATMAGNVAGNVGMAYLLPGSQATIPRAMAYSAAIEPEERLKAAALTGGLGLGFRALTGAPMIQPTAAQQRILAEGITPTPGQAAQSSGSLLGRTLGTLEEKAQSIPILGDVITAAKQRAKEDLGRVALSKATPPGEKALEETGQAGVEEAKGAFKSAYDKLYAGKTVSPDALLLRELNAAKTSTTLPLNAARGKEFDDLMQRTIWQRIPASGTLPADAAKREIEADLGKAFRELTKIGSSAEERSLGEAVKNAREAWRNMMMRTAGIPAAERAGVDKAYANLKDVEKASKTAMAQGGQFTPLQLQRAAKPGTELAEIAKDAQSVLKGNTPNSGTADRGLLAYFVMNPWAIPLAIGGALPAKVLYSKPVQRWLQGVVTPEVVQQSAPILTRGAVSYGNLHDPNDR